MISRFHSQLVSLYRREPTHQHSLKLSVELLSEVFLLRPAQASIVEHCEKQQLSVGLAMPVALAEPIIGVVARVLTRGALLHVIRALPALKLDDADALQLLLFFAPLLGVTLQYVVAQFCRSQAF